LVAHGTIDDKLMDSLVRKRDELAQVFALQREHQDNKGALALANPSAMEASVADDVPDDVSDVSDDVLEDHALAQLVCMGFEASDANAALEKAGGNLEDALETLTQAVPIENSVSPQVVPTSCAQSPSKTRDGLDDAIAQLVCMGFEASDANAALEKAGGNLEDALEILTQAVPTENSVCPQVVPTSCAQSSSKIQDGLDDAIAQLVGMGFGAAIAKDALQETGGNLDDALERLLSSGA